MRLSSGRRSNTFTPGGNRMRPARCIPVALILIGFVTLLFMLRII